MYPPPPILLCPPAGSHSHGPPDGPADPPGPAGRHGAARGGGLRSAGGAGRAPLPGHVHAAADQRSASEGELGKHWRGGGARGYKYTSYGFMESVKGTPEGVNNCHGLKRNSMSQ